MATTESVVKIWEAMGPRSPYQLGRGRDVTGLRKRLTPYFLKRFSELRPASRSRKSCAFDSMTSRLSIVEPSLGRSLGGRG
jgi:hypothetical protein